MTATTMLDQIKAKLDTFDTKVFYGTVAGLPNGAKWDYTVFNRESVSINSTNRTYVYAVHVVREDYVVEGTETTIINLLEQIPGVRFAGNDITVDYVTKPNTDRTVEMMTLTFNWCVRR